MMTDRETLFSNNQALAGAGTVVSTNSYDTGLAAHPNINTNRELQVFVAVGTAFAGGTDVTVNVIESDSSALTAPTILATSGAVTIANLTAGKRLIATPLPRTSKRYLGLQFVSTGVAHTAGTIWGGLVRDIDDTAFPKTETGYL